MTFQLNEFMNSLCKLLKPDSSMTICALNPLAEPQIGLLPPVEFFGGISADWPNFVIPFSSNFTFPERFTIMIFVPGTT